MKKTRRRREPSRRSANFLNGCRNTARHISRACEAFCVNMFTPCRRQVNHKANFRRSIVPKLIKMKEMSNSNRKSPRQRINRRKRARHRTRPNPSQKPPGALQAQVRPKRDRRRSSCLLNRLSEIIQVRRPKNSLQWEFQSEETIWLDIIIKQTAYVPPSRLLAILRANARPIPTTRASLSLKDRSPYRLSRKRRSFGRKAFLNRVNLLKKVSTILNFWLALSKSTGLENRSVEIGKENYRILKSVIFVINSISELTTDRSLNLFKYSVALILNSCFAFSQPDQ